jgi:hypothetical protein
MVGFFIAALQRLAGPVAGGVMLGVVLMVLMVLAWCATGLRCLPTRHPTVR